MTILGILFCVLLALGVPVAFTVGISAVSFFLTEGIPLEIVVQKMVSSTQSFSLLAVPFFVLAGNLMNETGITSRLIKFCNLATGHLRGGLAQVSVLLSCLMGGFRDRQLRMRRWKAGFWDRIWRNEVIQKDLQQRFLLLAV